MSDDPLGTARQRVLALLADLQRDRATLAGDAEGQAVYAELIDAARRVLETLDRPQADRDQAPDGT